jgi:hypothetical protein
MALVVVIRSRIWQNHRHATPNEQASQKSDWMFSSWKNLEEPGNQPTRFFKINPESASRMNSALQVVIANTFDSCLRVLL